MSRFFDVSEIGQFAVKIEENGEKFYRYAAQIAKDASVKQMFEYLADEENNHKVTFQKILLTIKEYEPLETYSGEYGLYLKAYIDNIIFSNLDEERSRVQDALSAINFGMQRELESILYYQEIKNFMKNQQEVIDTIIEEERKHFSTLSELKKKYTT
jgi:rubrerythrin